VLLYCLRPQFLRFLTAGIDHIDLSGIGCLDRCMFDLLAVVERGKQRRRVGLAHRHERLKTSASGKVWLAGANCGPLFGQGRLQGAKRLREQFRPTPSDHQAHVVG
jgi:hypothetical protein